MSDASEFADSLDASDVLRFLASEVQDSLVLLCDGVQRYGAFRLTSLRVRIGQTPTESTPTVHSALLSDRYPDASNGWQVDLAFDANANGKVLDIQTATGPVAPELACLDGAALFRVRPVSDLRGISSAWTRLLAKHGYTSVGQLDDLDDASTADLAAALGSQLISFRLQARLLHARLPVLIASPADDALLAELVMLTPTKLRAVIGEGRLSYTGAVLLASALQLYLTALGIGILREFTLGDLRATASDARS